MHNAKSRLSELVKKVISGEQVIISKNNEPVAILIPYKKDIKKRFPGLLKGLIWSSEDCWQPDEEVIIAIENSEIFPE